MKCQPAWRIMVSKAGAAISRTRFQLSLTGSMCGSKRSGKSHPQRKKTDWSLTLARFWILLEQQLCRYLMQSHWEGLQIRLRQAAWTIGTRSALDLDPRLQVRL